MKVETPQILWNNEPDKGINAPLLSIDIIESGIANETASTSVTNEKDSEYSHVLVTAGNAATINLWKVCFGSHTTAKLDDHCVSPVQNTSIFHKQAKPQFNKIDFMLSLDRHDATVNCVAFSPDGLHLATAGDSGNIVIWSVPVNKRGNNNGRHFWSTLKNEKDMLLRVVSTHCEGIVDISWSADSKRFTVGSIDSCVLIYEDKQYGTNVCSPESHQKESDWNLVYRNTNAHGSFVQGVAYDPLDAYIASMGGDRTVRVFPRKVPQKSKKVLRPSNRISDFPSKNVAALVTPPPNKSIVSQILTDAKIELGKSKSIKNMKQRVENNDDAIRVSGSDSKDYSTQTENQKKLQQKLTKLTNHKLFVDESNCESFFRRLNWTIDGAFLVTPAALWHREDEMIVAEARKPSESSSPLFSTYLFARHQFEKPYRVLTGLEKPSVVIRSNPVLFELPPSALDESKENQLPLKGTIWVKKSNSLHHDICLTSPSGLPYRSVFAVLTLDSVLIYDTHHVIPLCIIEGLHYSGLTDCCWSSNGLNLIICSSDGYVSIVNFAHGELGKVYESPGCSHVVKNRQSLNVFEANAPVDLPPLPPCDLEPVPPVLRAPVSKRPRTSQKTALFVSCMEGCAPSVGVDQTIASTTMMAPVKRLISDTEIVGEAVTNLSLENENAKNPKPGSQAIANPGEKPKKKKRIQPHLISNKI